ASLILSEDLGSVGGLESSVENGLRCMLAIPLQLSLVGFTPIYF
nr:hypothetical protein [Tanacetum cinerariifolium]